MTFDGVRAADVLESLEFVDSTRIGAVGHSLGAGGVCDLMAFDTRVKAGITSGGGPDLDQLACICPRLFMQLQGEHDTGSLKSTEEWQDLYNVAKSFYEAEGCPENLVLRVLSCAHEFIADFKEEAFARLEDYFS